MGAKTKKLKTVNISGKDYVEVNTRLIAFRSMAEYKGFGLSTEILDQHSPEGVVVIKATITNADGVVVSTGTAREKDGDGFINKTSYIENCETSAVGRALANLGIGIEGSVASYEEVANAKLQQGDEVPEKEPDTPDTDEEDEEDDTPPPQKKKASKAKSGGKKAPAKKKAPVKKAAPPPEDDEQEDEEDEEDDVFLDKNTVEKIKKAFAAYDIDQEELEQAAGCPVSKWEDKHKGWFLGVWHEIDEGTLDPDDFKENSVFSE